VCNKTSKKSAEELCIIDVRVVRILEIYGRSRTRGEFSSFGGGGKEFTEKRRRRSADEYRVGAYITSPPRDSSYDFRSLFGFAFVLTRLRLAGAV